MKKLALALALTLMAIAGTASAQGWYDNNVGVYFDEGATNNCDTRAPFAAFPAYLVFTQMTETEVAAWEMLLSFDNVTLMSFTPRHDHVLVAPRPGETMVGLASPKPVIGGMFVAADLQLLLLNANPAGIDVDGVYFHYLSNRVPAYTNAQGEGLELHPITQPGAPIMSINNGCAVATENSTFGEVKGLFR